MTSEINIANLYAHGRIAVAPDTLRPLSIDSALAGFLSTQGLPDLPPDDKLLGLSFKQPFAHKAANGSNVLIVAFEQWAESLYIGIEPKNEHVLALSGQQEYVTFINSSLPQFLDFLAMAQDFFNRAPELDDPGTPMTLEQAREEIAALRRGEIRPKSSSPSSFNRPKEVKRIRQQFRQIDAPALIGGTWWNRILEQMEDGLI